MRFACRSGRSEVLALSAGQKPAARSAMAARPSSAAQKASLPNSSRQAHSRLVAKCSACSWVKPIAPCTWCAMPVPRVAASPQRTLATAVLNRPARASLPDRSAAATSAAMRAAATSPAISARFCWMAWLRRSACRTARVRRRRCTVCSSAHSSAPTIIAQRAAAPSVHTGCAMVGGARPPRCSARRSSPACRWAGRRGWRAAAA
jgi:hypothetical protein